MGSLAVGAFAVAVMTARCLQIWNDLCLTPPAGPSAAPASSSSSSTACSRSLPRPLDPADHDVVRHGPDRLHALAVAAAVYILATWCLARGGRWVRVGVVACAFELVGVVVVGAISFLAPALFPDKTVWSHCGQGYGFVPLVLPVLGLLWFPPRRA